MVAQLLTLQRIYIYISLSLFCVCDSCAMPLSPFHSGWHNEFPREIYQSLNAMDNRLRNFSNRLGDAIRINGRSNMRPGYKGTSCEVWHSVVAGQMLTVQAPDTMTESFLRGAQSRSKSPLRCQELVSRDCLGSHASFPSDTLHARHS